jgi:hypothetical protein
MKKNNIIARYMNEANAAFSNYNGQVSGGRKEEFLGMAGMSRLSGGPASPNGIRTITLDIVNTDTQPLAAVIFGANEGFRNPFNGEKCRITGNTAAAGKGVIVTPKRYSVNELLELSKTSPMTFTGYRYDFGDEMQLKQDWTLRRKDGTLISDDLHSPSEMRNLANNIATAMDNPEFFMVVDAKGALFITLAAAHDANTPRKIQVIFKVGTQVDTGNALKGQSVLNQY